MTSSVDHTGQLPRPAPARGLNGRAWLFLVAITTLAVGGTALARLSGDEITVEDWRNCAIIAAGAAVMHLFVVFTPSNNGSYHTTMVVLVPAALVLPLELLPLVTIAQHSLEWAKARFPWYIQTFNIANYTVALLAAAAAARGIGAADGFISRGDLRYAVAGLVAAVLLVLINHFVLAVMLKLGRGHTFEQSGLFSLESLTIDFMIALLGVVVGFVFTNDVWLTVFALAPIILVHRSLSVPELQEAARADPKTGLYNARYFSEALRDEIDTAGRTGGRFSLLMIDLDLLRELNNTYGHLAGDAVLEGIAATLRASLRTEDIPSRFGGEEFAVLLPGLTEEQAVATAERLRAAVAATGFSAPTVDRELRATISIGVATFPDHATNGQEIVHQADLAVYRAKIQGRNRVVSAGSDLAVNADQSAFTAIFEHGDPDRSLDVGAPGPEDTYATSQPAAIRAAPRTIARIALAVGALGVLAGSLALALDYPDDLVGFLAITALVAIGQGMALRAETGSVSVAAVGMLAGVAMFGPGVALPLAITSAALDWFQRRPKVHQSVFNAGALTIAAMLASVPPMLIPDWRGNVGLAVVGFAAGALYFLVNTGLLAGVVGLEDGERPDYVWSNRFLWLFPHYIAYGFVGAVVAIAYETAHLYAIAVFAVPLVLMRASQQSYLRHTSENAEQLREAAQTIRLQNVSLEQANSLLRQRSMSALEGLSATVDARDAYTAGHSRRVQELALEIGRELGLSAPELEVLGYSALFHDIGKLAIPDAILLKPGPLDDREMAIMRGHAAEGAVIVSRLGFLADAVPGIRHHHEHWNGGGYPDGLAGVDIPVGARIVHVADAVDSMLTTRIYRAGRTIEATIEELRTFTGSQFCPRTAAAAIEVLSRFETTALPFDDRLVA
ncbi:MAG: diguanylate cyclase [Gaiella sp.]